MVFALRAALRPSVRAVAATAAIGGFAVAQWKPQQSYCEMQRSTSKGATESVSRTSSATKRELSQDTALWKAYEKSYGGNKNIQLTYSDVEDLLKSIGLKNKYMLAGMFQAMDEDSSGTVDFQELTHFCQTLSMGTVQDKATFLFNVTDADGGGTLDKQECRDMIRNLILCCHETLPSYVLCKSDQDVAFTEDLDIGTIALYLSNRMQYLFFKEADYNKDDVVSKDEFLKWVARGNKPAREFISFFDLFDHLLH